MSKSCRSAITCLHDIVRVLKLWSRSGNGRVGQGSSFSGHDLTLLETVLATLGDLLAMPWPDVTLHTAANDQVLDDLLVFMDACESRAKLGCMVSTDRSHQNTRAWMKEATVMHRRKVRQLSLIVGQSLSLGVWLFGSGNSGNSKFT